MTELDKPATRRAVLAGGLGAIAASLVGAVRPRVAEATNGDVVTVGGVFTGTSQTRILGDGVPAFNGQSNTSYGLVGGSNTQAGVLGNSISGDGVVGSSNNSNGVRALSQFGVGLRAVGETFSVDAQCSSSTGVGVRGWDLSPTGTTVGVVGRVDSPGGFAVLARNTAGGTALSAQGKIRFNRSGKTTITAGHSSKKVTLSGVASSSMVFAVLAQSRVGRYVRAVVPASGYFTIYLNGTVSSNTAISWFVLDPFV
jgi:hypothetical protein